MNKVMIKKRLNLFWWALKYNSNKKVIYYLFFPGQMSWRIYEKASLLLETVFRCITVIVLIVLLFLVYPFDVIYNVLENFIITPIKAFFRYDKYENIKNKLLDEEMEKTECLKQKD